MKSSNGQLGIPWNLWRAVYTKINHKTLLKKWQRQFNQKYNIDFKWAIFVSSRHKRRSNGQYLWQTDSKRHWLKLGFVSVYLHWLEPRGREDKHVGFMTNLIAWFEFYPHSGLVVASISAWWLIRTRSKFNGQEFEEIHRNNGSLDS